MARNGTTPAIFPLPNRSLTKPRIDPRADGTARWHDLEIATDF
jgi:hypothetical protein